MSSPARPDLKFDTLDALLADADRLRGGYERAGRWDLGMVLDHLARAMSGPFTPGRNWVPWPATAVARAAVHAMAGRDRYPTAVTFPALPSLRPTPGVDAGEAYAALRSVVERTAALPDGPVNFPPIGRVPRADYLGLQLLHAAHHLSFLRPTAAA